MENNRIIVKVGERDVDFSEVPPITGGDRKVLFAQGVDLRKLARADEGLTPEEDSKLLFHFVKKVDPKATEVEVDNIPSHIQHSILMHFMRKTHEVPNPFTPPSSTSSPASTAGDQKS